MARKKKTFPIFNRDDQNLLASGVGSGVGLAFVEDYFPEARQTIRIASAYFQLRGFELARQKINSHVQLRILVRGRSGSEGRNVQQTAIQIVDEIIADLGQCQIPLVEAVRTIVKQMNEGRFFIRNAHDIEPYHCKFYVLDESMLWHGSANFTQNGLSVNAEQIGLVRNETEVKGFIEWFDAVSAKGRDLLDLLKDKLEKWLRLASPYDIYLKTLLLLLQDSAREPFLDCANQPAYFQRGVVEKSLRQIKKFGGSLIVAATGLGKTVIGSQIALRLVEESGIKQVILLAPYNVLENWKAECDGRRVRCVEKFNIRIPFLEKSEVSYHEISRLERELRHPANEMLIVIDEAHNYRNQLLVQHTKDKKRNKRTSRVYDLLVPIIEGGAKIVLLTATAYSTSPANINSLLYLLPHKDRKLFPNIPWEINSTDQFSALPVVTTLGLPHVLKMARDREDVDENNRVYIRLADTKRYLPEKIILHRVDYRLPLQEDLLDAFDKNCFDSSQKVSYVYCDSDSVIPRRGVSDYVLNPSLVGWLSSPASTKLSLNQNLETPRKANTAKNHFQPNFFDKAGEAENHKPFAANGNGNSFKAEMLLSQADRQSILEPICKKLNEQTASDDEKFSELKTIVGTRISAEKGKVVVFVNRFSTALYIEEELRRAFGGNLKIGCTVEKGKGKLQLKRGTVRAEILKNFSPKSHRHDPKDKEYDLLICTDADGVGVNLQDANTLVNYDLPLGADVLFQRVGRILRMTDDAERAVHIYTFLPSIIKESSNGSSTRQKISDFSERLKQRQDKSKSISILGTKILSSEPLETTTLDAEAEIEDLLRESDPINEINLDASPFRHISLLETRKVRERAEAVPDYVFSARICNETEPRLFALFKYGDDYFPALYDIKTETISEPETFEILDILECGETEETAPVDAGLIEAESLRAAQAFCAAKNFSIGDVIRICSLYFAPSDRNKPRNIFGDLRYRKA